jgi:hypothetical protein
MTDKKNAPKKPTTAKAKGSKPEVEGEAQEEVSTNPELLTLNAGNQIDADFASEVDLGSEDVEGLGAMMAGHAPLDVDGYTFTAIFLGRRRVFSDKFKKTKKTLSFNGEEHTYRDILMFRSADGKEFGIWLTGELSRLTRLIPRSTAVKVTYVGKSVIEEGEYKGEEQHNFSVLPEKKALAEIEANKYVKGCLNWLSNPMEPREKDSTSKNMADYNNYINDVAAGKIIASDAEKKSLGITASASHAQIAQ